MQFLPNPVVDAGIGVTSVQPHDFFETVKIGLAIRTLVQMTPYPLVGLLVQHLVQMFTKMSCCVMTRYFCSGASHEDPKILPELSGCFGFPCRKSERLVERAKSKTAGEKKNNGEQAEDDCDRSGYQIGQIKPADDQGCEYSNDTVSISHILVHDCILHVERDSKKGSTLIR